MKRLLSVCLLQLCFAFPALAQTTASEKIVFNWLGKLQFQTGQSASNGAIRVHHTPAANSPDGTPFVQVSPYFGHLAALAVLKTQGSAGIPYAENWIRWNLRHLTPASAKDGVPYEHFYRASGSDETTCLDPANPKLCRYNDATDSAAALFLTVLYAFETSGGKQELLLNPKNRKLIEAQGETILKLQQSDGLVWAKADYPVEFLEDNCEVYEGLRSLALLEGRVYGDLKSSNRYQSAAERVRAGILTTLYDPINRRYRVSKQGDKLQDSDGKTWYPDLQAQFWVTLFRVEPAGYPHRKERLNSLLEAWDREAKLATSSLENAPRHLHPEAAYALTLLGEKTRASAHLADILRLKLPKTPADIGFDWQFTCADGGWILLTLSALRSNSPH